MIVETICIPRNADISGGAVNVCYESKNGKLEQTKVANLIANKSKNNLVATFENECIVFFATMYKDTSTGLFQVSFFFFVILF